MNNILTVRQIADKLQVNKETVYRWLRTGKLTSYKANKLWRVAEDDLTSFLKQRTGAGQAYGDSSKKNSLEQVADLAPDSSRK